MQGNINDLIDHNKGLVYAQLHRFNLVYNQDAESIAYEALYHAISNYDENMHAVLSTYATVCIYNALGSFLRTLNKQRQLEVISYNNCLPSDDGGEYLDGIASCASVEKEYLDSELNQYVMNAYNLTFNRLTTIKHREIVQCWKESSFSASTVEISRTVHVSQSYVSQVINKFKANMKMKVEAYYID